MNFLLLLALATAGPQPPLSPLLTKEGSRVVSPLLATEGSGAVSPLLATEGSGAVSPLLATEGSGAVSPLLAKEGSGVVSPLLAKEGKQGWSPAGGGPPNAVVILPVANMYSKPTEDADVVSQAICGTNVAIVEEQGDWVKARTPDNYLGWMPLASLRRLEAGDKPYASSEQVVQVESLFANLYREPDVTKHAPLVTLPFEARLELTRKGGTGGEGGEGRWLEVRLPDDRQAWVQRGDVTFDPKPLTIQETIELAKRFLGEAYLWGGRSSFGFDCSGFTQMLVRLRGANMPRDADLQAAWDGATPVKRNKLKPGDLLFFGSSPDKITHTGLYIGHGNFIHDTTHGHPGVQISRLKDPHWTKLLVACRRVK